MQYSLPAWLGALAGTVVAVIFYVPSIRKVERRLRTRLTLEQVGALQEKFSILRRVILFVDIAICATLGYWIGNAIGAAFH
jgi:hypothetical protein